MPRRAYTSRILMTPKPAQLQFSLGGPVITCASQSPAVPGLLEETYKLLDKNKHFDAAATFLGLGFALDIPFTLQPYDPALLKITSSKIYDSYYTTSKRVEYFLHGGIATPERTRLDWVRGITPYTHVWDGPAIDVAYLANFDHKRQQRLAKNLRMRFEHINSPEFLDHMTNYIIRAGWSENDIYYNSRFRQHRKHDPRLDKGWDGGNW